MQRSSFTHPDLHDELVDELVSVRSPLAPRTVSGAASFLFLLLGDQNAGKSTFLHAFTHAASASWLELMSLLPILSSSFSNVQLGANSGSSGRSPPAMDEPPFIDTDVGRATFLLTLEDFAFFVDEFGLPLPRERLQELAIDSGVRYALIELIEIGGDHIDRMRTWLSADCTPPTHTTSSSVMTSENQHHERAPPLLPPPPSLLSALRRSEQLLAGAHRSLYFLNAASLLRVDATTDRLRVQVGAFAQLLHRLRYLARVLPRGQRVQLHLCRLPSEQHLPFDYEDAHALLADLKASSRAHEMMVFAFRLARLDAADLLRRATQRHDSHQEHAQKRQAGEQAELHPQIRPHATPPPRVALLCAMLPELLHDLLQDGPHSSISASPPTSTPPAAGAMDDRDTQTLPPTAPRSGAVTSAPSLQIEGVVVVASHVQPPPPPPPQQPHESSSTVTQHRGGGAASFSLDIPAVVGTLASLFDSESLYRPPPPPSVTASLAAASELLQCFKSVSLRFDTGATTSDSGAAAGAGAGREPELLVVAIEPVGGTASEGRATAGGSPPQLKGAFGAEAPLPADSPSGGADHPPFFNPWVTVATWEAHLEDADDRGTHELPTTALARSFGAVAERLCAAGLALRHHGGGHADLCVRFELHDMAGTKLVRSWRAGTPDVRATSATKGREGRRQRGALRVDDAPLRFPYSTRLLAAVEAPIVSGLPAEWWLGSAGEGAAVALLDMEAVHAAEVELHERLQAQLVLHMHDNDEVSWHVFLWLLEEWCLACSLLRRAAALVDGRHPARPSGEHGGGGEEDEGPFELRLQAPEDLWRRALLQRLPPPSPLAESAEEEVMEEVGEEEAVDSHGRARSWRVTLTVAAGEEDGSGATGMCLACE